MRIDYGNGCIKQLVSYLPDGIFASLPLFSLFKFSLNKLKQKDLLLTVECCKYKMKYEMYSEFQWEWYAQMEGVKMI